MILLDCATCKKEHESVPYTVYDGAVGALSIAENHNKRMFIIILVLIFLLVGSNIAWIVYESQFEDVVTQTQEVEQHADGDGFNQFVGGDMIGN